MIVKRCLRGESDICPEAATRSDVWNLEPDGAEILGVACDRDHGLSCYHLGKKQTEDEKAAPYFVHACDSGFAEGCYEMGLRFGKGAPFDGWFFRACEGDATYCTKIAKRLSSHTSLPSDEQEWIRRYWYGRGCEMGEADGCDALASLERSRVRRQEEFYRKAERSRQQALTAQRILQTAIASDPERLKGAVLIWSGSSAGFSLSEYYGIRFMTPDGEMHSWVYPASR